MLSLPPFLPPQSPLCVRPAAALHPFAYTQIFATAGMRLARHTEASFHLLSAPPPRFPGPIPVSYVC